MKILLKNLKVKYIGVDIVEELINSNNLNYKSKNIKFQQINLITDELPYSDLMICRDCLFHLSYNDIQSVLKQFLKSEIPYLLTTTYKNKTNFKNANIRTGDFRKIDLFLRPFNFPKKPLARIDDFLAPEPEREMVLFNRKQILSIYK